MTTPTTVQVRLQLRADTAANWTTNDPVLLANELGRETDTGKIKIGNGSTIWSSLAYQPFGALITNADIAANAEIAVSKLADGAARQLLQTAANGTDVEWASNIDIPGTLDVTGVATFDGNVTVQGDLTVNGTTVTVNTETLTVKDKNIELAVVTSPTDATADGGGITLKGTTDKTINWVDATDAWTFSEHVNIASGKEYRINGVKVLDGASLGTGITGSSLTSVGTIGTGTWQGTAVGTAYGGTGQTTYSNGQLLIGKTDGTLAKATLTAGTGVAVTNADGSVTVAVDSTVVTTAQTGTVTSAMIADGTIVNADINASAGIVDTKLATIATAGKVSNSATTATSANTNSAIVARDGSGNFSAGTVTASLTGAASFNVLKAGDTMTGALSVPLGTAALPSLYPGTDTNTGIYSPGADQLAISTNGVERVKLGTSEVVFNDGGNDIDFRIEGDTNSSLFFVDASTDRVGIGTTSPNSSLEISSASADSSSKLRVRRGGITSNFIELGTNGGESQITANGVTSINAALIFARDSNTGTPTESARIDGSGRVLIGTSTARNNLFNTSGVGGLFNLETTGQAVEALFVRNQNNAFGAVIYLAKTRSASVGGNTIVNSGDSMGEILFGGNDGSEFVEAASILAQVDGTPGANDMPGRLVFSTTADGASSPTERLRITNAGVLQVADAGNVSVGTTTGTKIGTATTQKLGFYNATPVVQPTAVADATDAASVITQLNALLTRMRNLGLIAT
jgi:hypothetical protein